MIRWFRELEKGHQVTLLAGIPAALIAATVAIAVAAVRGDATTPKTAPTATAPAIPFAAPSPSLTDVPSDQPSDETPSDDVTTDESSADNTIAKQTGGAVSYTTVDLLPLCDQTDCSGSRPVGGTVFQYTDEVEAGDYPHFDSWPAFGQGRNTCRFMDVQFAGDDSFQRGGHPSIDYLTFKQSSTPAVSASVKVGKVAHVHVPLDGGPLWIDASTENDPGVHNNYVLLKVTGSCSTPNGLPD